VYQTPSQGHAHGENIHCTVLHVGKRISILPETLATHITCDKEQVLYQVNI